MHKVRTIRKVIGVEWDFFSVQEFFSRPLPLQDFSLGQVPCTISWGGWRMEDGGWKMEDGGGMLANVPLSQF